MIERMFNKSRGIPNRATITSRVYRQQRQPVAHLLRAAKYTGHVTVFVCRKSANIGMALTKARLAHPEIEASV